MGFRRLAALSVLVGCGPAARMQAPPADPVLPVPTVAIGAAITASPDLRRVPSPIAVPYVESVLAALNHVEGEAWRRVQGAGSVTSEAVAMIEATTTPDFVDTRTQTLANILLVDPSLLRPSIADPVSSVERLLDASATCVALIAVVDTTGIRPTSVPRRTAIRLRPSASAQEPDNHFNPTAFAVDATFVLEAANDEPDAAALCE